MRLCGATWRHSLYCIEYATIPPCNTTPYFSTHLPRQFLGVRGLVYKGGAVSRSAVCLLGLGADCLCFSSGSSKFLRGFTVWFLPSKLFEKVWKVLLWMRFPFWFLLVKLSGTFFSGWICYLKVLWLSFSNQSPFAKGFPASICLNNCTSDKQMKWWGCVALHGNILYTVLNLLPSLHAISCLISALIYHDNFLASGVLSTRAGQ